MVRNFAASHLATVEAVCDTRLDRLESMKQQYPFLRVTTDALELLKDPAVEAICICTPVGTHFPLAREALRHGKHVLVEKPLAASVEEAETLVKLAQQQDRCLMVDHTFVYTGAVRKIREIVARNELGRLLYYDSVRVNLGLFQEDVNVLWDLGPHDLSILDYVLGRAPKTVSAVGGCHVKVGVENTAYVALRFEDELLAHFHFNWLSPVKIRMTLIGGTEKMIVYNDLEPAEKVKVYDKGVVVTDDSDARHMALFGYRVGDMWSPTLDTTEALKRVCAEFANAIVERRRPLTDGECGLRVVRILEAAQKSLASGGTAVSLR